MVTTTPSLADTSRELAALASERGPSYRQARPFPHACCDGVFPPDLLRRVVEEIAASDRQDAWAVMERPQKSHRKHVAAQIGGFGPASQSLDEFFSGSAFVNFLEELTGIRGLLTDPHRGAAGYHEYPSGGFLELHADFSWNPRIRLYRRINVILYLNMDWRDEYGGALELWDRGLRNSIRYAPLLNRMVIANVEAGTLHGFPDPLRCPPSIVRRSVALWYYTSELPLSMQTPYDISQPDFVTRRNGQAQAVPRSWSRRLIPPLFQTLLGRVEHTRPTRLADVAWVLSRLLPPALTEMLLARRRRP